MSPPRREVHDATAAVRVRSALEARARLVQAGTWMPPGVLTVITEGGVSHPLYVADVAALLGDPVPADPPMSRHTDGDDPADGPVCALCGHHMTMTRCGSGTAPIGGGTVSLCHTSERDHDCYHRWTVYGDRPAGWCVDCARIGGACCTLHASPLGAPGAGSPPVVF